MTQTYRGVVCEKKTGYTVFLTRDGKFLRGIPLGITPDVGAEFRLIGSTFLRKKIMKPFILGPAIVATMLLLFMIISFIPTTNKVMAYVQLETNSAVEFGVDKEGKVITFRQLNEDTSSLENNESRWKGMQIDTVLDEVLAELSTINEQEVVITTIFNKVQNEKETQEIVERAVNDVKTKHTELKWDVSESTTENRDLANEKGTTIHKFNQGNQNPSNGNNNGKSEGNGQNIKGNKNNNNGNLNRNNGGGQGKNNNPNDSLKHDNGKQKQNNKEQQKSNNSNKSKNNMNGNNDNKSNNGNKSNDSNNSSNSKNNHKGKSNDKKSNPSNNKGKKNHDKDEHPGKGNGKENQKKNENK